MVFEGDHDFYKNCHLCYPVFNGGFGVLVPSGFLRSLSFQEIFIQKETEKCKYLDILFPTVRTKKCDNMFPLPRNKLKFNFEMGHFLSSFRLTTVTKNSTHPLKKENLFDDFYFSFLNFRGEKSGILNWLA